MTHRVSKRDIVLFVIAQVVSISLLVLFLVNYFITYHPYSNWSTS